MIYSKYVFNYLNMDRFKLCPLERGLKHLFYVSLVCSLINLPCIVYILLTDENLSKLSFYFLLAIAVLVLLCLGGLGYCYYRIKKISK